MNLKNKAQILVIVSRSGETLGDHLKQDQGETIPRVKSKEVPPISHEEEDEKQLVEVDEEVQKNG